MTVAVDYCVLNFWKYSSPNIFKITRKKIAGFFFLIYL
jgi:hypothetical protein